MTIKDSIFIIASPLLALTLFALLNLIWLAGGLVGEE